MRHPGTIVIVAVAAAFVGGCTPDFGARQEFPVASISPRDQWRVTGPLSDASLAIDGNAQTTATTSGSYTNAQVTVDLGKVCVFNLIIVDHGPSEMGFCRRVAMSTSVDGKEFTYRGGSPGTRTVSYFPLVTPVVARYVRLQAVVPGAQAWSLGEIYLQ